jgi:hypothetical protein
MKMKMKMKMRMKKVYYLPSVRNAS